MDRLFGHLRMVRAAVAQTVLVPAVMATFLGCGLTHDGSLVPAQTEVVRRHPQSVRLLVIGADRPMLDGRMMINNAKFRAAVSEAIERTRLFAQVVTEGEADLELRTYVGTIVPPIQNTVRPTAALKATWVVVPKGTSVPILEETLWTLATGSTSDALWTDGVIKSAVRDHIAQALRVLSDAPLDGSARDHDAAQLDSGRKSVLVDVSSDVAGASDAILALEVMLGARLADLPSIGRVHSATDRKGTKCDLILRVRVTNMRDIRARHRDFFGALAGTAELGAVVSLLDGTSEKLVGTSQAEAESPAGTILSLYEGDIRHAVLGLVEEIVTYATPLIEAHPSRARTG